MDILSIDGFECVLELEHCTLGDRLMEFITGAGHPGEEDVPGLVLVC